MAAYSQFDHFERWTQMRILIAEIKQWLRQLGNNLVFTVVALLSLGVAIGAGTVMSTIINRVLINPLPYPRASELFSILPAGGTGFATTSWVHFEEFKKRLAGDALVGGYSNDLAVIRKEGAGVTVPAPRVTPDTFRMLGVQPLLGRTFFATDEQGGAPLVVLLSEGVWRHDFHADPNVIGKLVWISGNFRSVVGVLPASFLFPEEDGDDMRDAIWLPYQSADEMRTDRSLNDFFIIARRGPGISQGSIRTRVRVIESSFADKSAGKDAPKFAVVPYSHLVVGSLRQVILILCAGTVLLLLIACSNVANLLIARSIQRRHDFAIRVALGASRRRLAGQMLMEGAILSLLGASLGLILACSGMWAIRRLPQDTLPHIDSIHLDWTVVLSLMFVTGVATILSSLLPALLVSHHAPQTSLQASSRGFDDSSPNKTIRKWLVSVEVAISTLLLIATGLLGRTMVKLQTISLGFATTNVATFQVTPPDLSLMSSLTPAMGLTSTKASLANTLYQPVLERLNSIPGVQSSALVTVLPFSGSRITRSFRIMGAAASGPAQQEAQVTAVGGDYASVMDAQMLAGRMIDRGDNAHTLTVAVVNQAFADRYLKGGDVVGKQIALSSIGPNGTTPVNIVGVVADERQNNSDEPTEPLIMLSANQLSPESSLYQQLLGTVVNVVVRTRGDLAIAGQVRSIFKQISPDSAVDNFQGLDDLVRGSRAKQQIAMVLTAAFAFVGTIIAIGGLVSVLSQMVASKNREIAIRMAVGATRGSILTMFLKQGLVISVSGIAIGLILSLAFGKILGVFLFEIQPYDPVTYITVAVLLFLIAIGSCVWPARQASLAEPVNALHIG